LTVSRLAALTSIPKSARAAVMFFTVFHAAPLSNTFVSSSFFAC
jgi:hypothetical protein